MAKVKVLISTMRYGSNGFKHKGDEFNLPDELAKEKAAQGFVKILSLDSDKAVKVKQDKAVVTTKELKTSVKTK